MGKLGVEYSPKFKRDLKRLVKKHVDTLPLQEVIDLIIENSEASNQILTRRHNMHALRGALLGEYECHVCNAGDWLLIWYVSGNKALLQRTGSHDELLR